MRVRLFFGLHVFQQLDNISKINLKKNNYVFDIVETKIRTLHNQKRKRGLKVLWVWTRGDINI